MLRIGCAGDPGFKIAGLSGRATQATQARSGHAAVGPLGPTPVAMQLSVPQLLFTVGLCVSPPGSRRPMCPHLAFLVGLGVQQWVWGVTGEVCVLGWFLGDPSMAVGWGSVEGPC